MICVVVWEIVALRTGASQSKLLVYSFLIFIYWMGETDGFCYSSSLLQYFIYNLCFHSVKSMLIIGQENLYHLSQNLQGNIFCINQSYQLIFKNCEHFQTCLNAAPVFCGYWSISTAFWICWWRMPGDGWPCCNMWIKDLKGQLDLNGGKKYFSASLVGFLNG